MIGNEKLPRYDSLPRSTGTQHFTIDVKLPGMLTAVMIHPPLFGATVEVVRRHGGEGDARAWSTWWQIPRGVAVVAEQHVGGDEGPRRAHRRVGRERRPRSAAPTS